MRKTALAVLLLALSTLAGAQETKSRKFPLNATLPLAPDIKTGALPNGLKFYIRKNARPEKRVSLRLAVKAGSLEEHDDQLGLAHLIEHMAFNGSEHFKSGEGVSYFERVGARLGPHGNASTGFC